MHICELHTFSHMATVWQPCGNWVATAPHKETRHAHVKPPQEWTWHPSPGWWKQQVVNVEPGNFRHKTPHGHASSKLEHCNVHVCVNKFVEASTGARVCTHARHCTMCGLHRYRHTDSYGQLQIFNCLRNSYHDTGCVRGRVCVCVRARAFLTGPNRASIHRSVTSGF